MLKRLRFETREEWLEGRQKQGLGGSDAAAIVGMSPWSSPLQLWKQKLGIEKPKDLSGNPAVEQGVKMESVLRDFYHAIHPEYEMWHHPYDILFQEKRPWLFASLDAELLDEQGRYGILEIKTATPTAGKWKEWADGKMPMNYYCQVLHQLLATDYDYIRLFACLYSLSGDMTLKSYEIEREDVKDDLEWLLGKETFFWEHNIKGGEMPSMILTL